MGGTQDVAEAQPLLPKLVAGLLAARRAVSRSGAHWTSTHETGWVLIALDAYYHKFEAVVPDFKTGVWLQQR